MNMREVAIIRTIHSCQARLLTILLALISLGVPHLVQAARHALLIGVSDYSGTGLPDLPGTHNDLVLMQKVLQDRLGFGAGSDSTLHILENQQATHCGIARGFAELAQRVQPGDFVYIHYSGHGSYTQDLNGDEVRSGQDQTWVSYGSRSTKADDIDQYDILDDEVNEWLGRIAERTSNLVIVSDSCHSATITRGETPGIRAAPPSTMGDHPLGRNTFQRYGLESVVRVAAARDDESAHEFENDQKPPQRYGVFTWNWARSIERAMSGESWEQLFTRTTAWISISQGETQHPQIAGKPKSESAFGGSLSPLEAKVVVKEVDADGQKATLAVGKLVGATAGSEYAPLQKDSPVTARLTEVYDTWSRGEIRGGTLAAGDFLRETAHSYLTSPLRVFVTGDPGATEGGWLERVRGVFPAVNVAEPVMATGSLSGYELVNTQAQADLVVYLLQPKRSPEGAYQYRKTPGGGDTLPEHDPDAPREVWVLTPAERLLHERMRIRLAEPEKGLETLRNNLRRYRRIRALEELAEASSGSRRADVQLIVFSRCATDQPNCVTLPENNNRYRRGELLPLSDLSTRQWGINDLISFRIKNRMHREQYVYLLDISPDGCIQTLFPTTQMPVDAARIPAYGSLDLSIEDNDALLLFDKPGDGDILVVATERQIDPALLEQECYQTTRKGEPHVLNPLEQLLVTATQRTRGSVSFSSGSWGSQLARYRVSSGDTTR